MIIVEVLLLWAIKYIKRREKEVEVKLACSPSVGLPGNILQHVQGEIVFNSTQKKNHKMIIL